MRFVSIRNWLHPVATICSKLANKSLSSALFFGASGGSDKGVEGGIPDLGDRWIGGQVPTCYLCCEQVQERWTLGTLYHAHCRSHSFTPKRIAGARQGTKYIPHNTLIYEIRGNFFFFFWLPILTRPFFLFLQLSHLTRACVDDEH